MLPANPNGRYFCSVLCYSITTTAIYALAEHVTLLSLGLSLTAPCIWIPAVSPIHLWCASICLSIHQKICKGQTEHVDNTIAKGHSDQPNPEHKGPSWLEVVFLLPAAILNAITSGAMVLLERDFDQPRAARSMATTEAALECCAIVLFSGCRYADLMILRHGNRQFSDLLRRADIGIGLTGVLSLLVLRSLLEALLPISMPAP